MKLPRRPYRLMLAAAIAVASTASLTGPATAGPPPRQEVQGEVLAPSGPRAVGPILAGACEFVAANTEYATRTSPTLFRFAVAANTVGRRFELVPNTPADLDIAFVGRDASHFETRNMTGESGTIPADSSGAIVCLAAGAKTGFTYTAY